MTSSPISGTDSPIFQTIESLQGELPWGSFLDAGTGRKSIEWVSALPTERWTAITASRSMANATSEAAGAARRPQDRILVANWMEEHLLYGERFDTVLLDYFIGAIEGFAPTGRNRCCTASARMSASGSISWAPSPTYWMHLPPRPDASCAELDGCGTPAC